MCEQNGIACSRRGSCGPGPIGCVCDKLQGEYCEEIDQIISPNNSAYSENEGTTPIIISLVLILLFLC